MTELADTRAAPTARHRALYRFLSDRAGLLVTHYDFFVHFHWNSNDLKVAICQLRKHLPETEEIETIWGYGYRFRAAPTLTGRDTGGKSA